MKSVHSLSDKFVREHSATADDIIFTRREFLEKTGMGMGAMSLASILGMGMQAQSRAALGDRPESRRTAFSEAAAIQGQGQGGHSSLRLRRPFAGGYVGSEARTDQIQRQDHSRP